MKTNAAAAILCVLPVALFAAERQPAAELDNFDARPLAHAAPEPLAGPRLDAASALQRKIPGIQIDLDAVTATPAWIRSSVGFITGPDATDDILPNAVQVAGPRNNPPDRLQPIKKFLEENAALFGHGAAVLDTAPISREFVTEHNGLRTVVWQQELDGISVFEGLLVAHLTRIGELVNLRSRFLPDADSAADVGLPNRQFAQQFPLVSAQQAIANAATNIGEVVNDWQVEALDPMPEGAAKRQKFRAPGLLGDTHAELVWLPMDGTTLRLCWRVILTGATRNEMFQVLVDTQTGHVQVRHSWTFRAQPATFRVFSGDSPSPLSPAWSTPSTNQPPLVPQTNITLTALSTNASPNGWVNTNSALFLFVNTTMGNNVDAHTDLLGFHNPDYDDDLQTPNPDRPVGTLSNGVLQFLFEVNLTNQSPATNFPARNQDAGVVNAFYWANWMHDRLYDLGFTEAAGNYQRTNIFYSGGATNNRGGVGSDAVLVDVQNGANDLTNSNFNYVNGAEADGPPIDGMPGRLQFTLFNQPSPHRDSDLDTEFLLHEYTHLMTARLMGHGTSISAPQSAAMSEGTSDFFSLALLAETGDDTNATYAWGAWAEYRAPIGGTNVVENYYYGGRRYPYSIQLSKNPLTLGDARELRWHAGVPINPAISNALVLKPNDFDDWHLIGEIWCEALWEARAIYISKYGFTNGTDRILRLVMDGMKLGPANPTYLQARDAILLADRVTTSGVDQTNLWTVFAKRGMGWSAICPASYTTDGIFESFDMPPPDGKLWAFITGHEVNSSPAIGHDGTIYVGSVDTKLYAINPDGTQRWTFTGPYRFDSSPAVGLDGTVYVGGHGGKLYAITNGVAKWSNYLGGLVDCSPAIGADGTVYVGVGNTVSNVVAFSPDGTRLWAATLGTFHYVYSSPAVASNGTLYVGCMDGWIYALNHTNGLIINSNQTGDGIYSSPAIAWDGSVYVGSLDGKVYGFDASLNLKSGWPINTGSNIYCSPAIASDGTIYIGSDDTKLYSLNPNGSQRWSRPTGGRVRATPAIGADGTVFLGSYDWRVYSLGTNGATNWTYTTGFNIFSSPVIGANGVLYVGSKDTKLYALPASTYPAGAMWPTFRRNLRHTAEAATIWLQPGFSYPPDEFGEYRFDFDIYGLPNQFCTVESSGDLVNWTSAGTYTTMADGILTVMPGHIGPAYYRVKSGDVRSLNVLGVAILTNLPSPAQMLMANPFNTPNNTVAAILPGVPEGTKFSKWNESTQSYQTNTFSSGQWSDLGMTLRPGEGGLLTNPSSATLEIHLQGEVLQGDLSNSLPAGLSIRTSMVPQRGLVQSNLGYVPQAGDEVKILTNNTLVTYTFGSQWSPVEPVLEVGQAAFIQSTNAKAWRRRFFVWP